MTRALVIVTLTAGLAGPAAAWQSPATLDVLLDRAGAYLAGYEKSFASVVSEERYVQTFWDKTPSRVNGAQNVGGRRELRSDVVAVVDGQQEWLTFRDVYAVDGRPVRDRDARLQTLFLDPKSDALTSARQIADEGARFNLGPIRRNVNFATMPLTFLTRAHQSHSAFRLGNHERVHGVDAAVVSFEETERPTIVKSAAADLPMSGRFWIEPATGRVLKADVSYDTRDLSGRVTVTFALVEKVKMWLPEQMDDSITTAWFGVNGRATYSNVRQFRVSTDVVIK